MATLIEKFSHLKPLNAPEYTKEHLNGATKNLRAHLKHCFPGVKFSVRRQNCDTIYIKWVDGPAPKQVKEQAELFEGKSFDGMQDLETFNSSEFINTFGRLGYIFTDREESDELLQKTIDELSKKYSDNIPTVADIRSGEANRTSPICNWDGHYFWSWRNLVYKHLEEQAA